MLTHCMYLLTSLTNSNVLCKCLKSTLSYMQDSAWNPILAMRGTLNSGMVTNSIHFTSPFISLSFDGTENVLCVQFLETKKQTTLLCVADLISPLRKSLQRSQEATRKQKRKRDRCSPMETRESKFSKIYRLEAKNTDAKSFPITRISPGQ